MTFLFTDIEGSTKLAQQYPDEMLALLARHHEMLHRSIRAHNGYVFQVVGDSFAAAFHSASDALHAALAAQRNLYNAAWSPAPIRVRMGIHTGEARLNDASAPTVYTGYATIASAQRIMSAGHGGQVLLSGATREPIRDRLPAGSELLDLGERRLKDLLHPEHLYQLTSSGLPSSFAPLKTLDTFPNNLPPQLTTFIGRAKEIAEVKQELENHRLVTLIGSGGTGKTRLSLQVAADLLEKFEQGVWFVELAPLTDPESIPQTILSTIGIREQPGQRPIELLKEYLIEKKVLIVIDNCEHLVEASAKVLNTLLNAVPNLTVLVSSREALGIKGEFLYPVPSLSLPDIKHLPVIEQLSQYEAVRLFIDRAALVSPHFDLDQSNATFIAQICYRLDGIPLAIELAAARVRLLSVEQIAKRLDDRFRFLTGGARTALPRQQTLRALIDWSYDLLSEKECLLLHRLSVFSDDWGLEAAEAVGAGVGQDDISPYDVLDLLMQLVNKSLVEVVSQPGGEETRYRMLETIRQYAREKLLETGEGEQIRDRHFDYYLQAIKQADREFFSPKERVWLVWFENEWDNLRAAVEWSLPTHADLGLELVNDLGHMLSDALYNLIDMDNWLWQWVRHPLNSTRTAQRAQGLLNCSLYATYVRAGQEDMSPLQAYSSEDMDTRFAHFQRALQLFREANDKPRAALTLLHMGWWMGSLEASSRLSYLEESLALYRELGYISGTIEALKQIGAIEVHLGHFDKAHRWLDEAFSILQAYAPGLGDSRILYYDLGDLAYHEGDYELAQKYYEHCLAWATQKGLSISISWAKIRLGYLFTRRGEHEKAFLFLREALFSFQRAGVHIGLMFTLEGLASLAAAQTRYGKAV